MATSVDDEFYARADAHIRLANEQLSEQLGRGKVSASLMFATARFNAWVSASGFTSGPEMRERRAATVAYFVEEYQKMLEQNLDDYAANFDEYMRPQG